VVDEQSFGGLIDRSVLGGRLLWVVVRREKGVREKQQWRRDFFANALRG